MLNKAVAKLSGTAIQQSRLLWQRGEMESAGEYSPVKLEYLLKTEEWERETEKRWEESA